MTLLAICSVTADVRAQAVPEPVEPLISSPAEFWQASGEKRPHVHRMDITVVPTYADPHWKLLWGFFADNGTGFLPAMVPANLRLGARYRIAGTYIPAEGWAPLTLQFTLLEDAVEVPVVQAGSSADEIITAITNHDAAVLEFDAYVASQVAIDPHHTALSLVIEGMPVTAHIYALDGRPPDDYAMARVRVRGVCFANRDPAGNFVSGELWVPRPEQVRLLHTLDQDPLFERPVTTIDSITTQEKSELIRVVGRVDAYAPGTSLRLRDGYGQVDLQTAFTMPLQIGDEVEAVGLPSVQGIHRVLRHGLFRPLKTPLERREIPDTSAPLRLADQVLALLPDEVALGRPVRLWGVVTWSSPHVDYLFFRDASAALKIALPHNRQFTPERGSAIMVDGVTQADVPTPTVLGSARHTGGVLTLPDAHRIKVTEALSGKYSNDLVEIQGFVTRVANNRPWTELTVSTPEGVFQAHLPFDERAAPLQHAVVRIRGVCETYTNPGDGVSLIRLWTGSAADAQIEAAMPADHDAVASQSIASLQRFATHQETHFWTRTRGIVTGHRPGLVTFVQNGPETLLVFPQAEHQPDPAPGEEIDILGLADFEGRRLVLREALWRKTGRTGVVIPTPLTQPEQLDESRHGRLTEIEGTIVDQRQRGADLHFTIQAGGGLFEALLNAETYRGSGRVFANGARVRVNGVYVLETDERRRARAFHLLVPSPADVTVLTEPSWWTSDRALRVAWLMALGLGAAVWRLWSARNTLLRQAQTIAHQAAETAQLEAHNKEIIERATDVVLTTDAHGRIRSFNPAGERMSGYAAADIIGRHIGTLLQGEEVPRGLGMLEGAIRDDSVTLQCQFRKRGGEYTWVEIGWTRLSSQNTRPGLLGIMRDITARKQFEENLARSRDAAEAATRAKSVFLANMSHELRTPMNGIIGMTSLLLDSPLEAEQREFAQTVRTSADALLNVLDDILDFSKIEAGKLEFDHTDFELRTVVEDTLKLLAPRAADKNIGLAVFVAPELPHQVRGDPSRLRQVLLNLLGNAVKFTPAGQVDVLVSAETTAAGEPQLCFAVRDTGIGMSPEETARLFRPFSQADTSTTRRFGGTGLGLAISKQIVELAGGTIQVRSTPGQGSTFSFTLPLVPSAGQEETAVGSAPDTPCRHALVVDASETRQRLYRGYLASWNIECTISSDATRARELIHGAVGAARPVDVVFLDPPGDGFDLPGWCRQLRQDPVTARVAVVVLTSVFQRLPREDLAALHIHATLLKPLTVADLRSALSDLRAGDRATEGGASIVPRPAAAMESDGALRILAVEDNLINQRVLQLHLRKLGYTADFAANGVEALAALDKDSYDLVLMDCQMPLMDGYEATRRIRADERWQHLPVIAMTANAMQGDRELCLEAGMSDYLSKPLQPADLRVMLDRFAATRNPPSDRVSRAMMHWPAAKLRT